MYLSFTTPVAKRYDKIVIVCNINYVFVLIKIMLLEFLLMYGSVIIVVPNMTVIFLPGVFPMGVYAGYLVASCISLSTCRAQLQFISKKCVCPPPHICTRKHCRNGSNGESRESLNGSDRGHQGERLREESAAQRITYTHIHTQTYACTCANVRPCTHTHATHMHTQCTYMRIHTHATYTHMHRHAHTHSHIHPCIYTYTRAHAYTYTHPHIHTVIHTHIQAHTFMNTCTVVPALGDPRRERPPAVCGHFVNVPTHFKVKLPVISGHLPNADSHLLVVCTCYNGQCKQIPRFRWSFQPKIAARTQTCDRQISQMSVLSSGDYDNACIH